MASKTNTVIKQPIKGCGLRGVWFGEAHLSNSRTNFFSSGVRASDCCSVAIVGSISMPPGQKILERLVFFDNQCKSPDIRYYVQIQASSIKFTFFFAGPRHVGMDDQHSTNQNHPYKNPQTKILRKLGTRKEHFSQHRFSKCNEFLMSLKYWYSLYMIGNHKYNQKLNKIDEITRLIFSRKLRNCSDFQTSYRAKPVTSCLMKVVLLLRSM